MPCFSSFRYSPSYSVFEYLFTDLFQDIDECSLTPPCGPGFNCINTAGSYMCHRKLICSRGHHASPDGSRCIGKIFNKTHTNIMCREKTVSRQQDDVVIYLSSHLAVKQILCQPPIKQQINYCITSNESGFTLYSSSSVYLSNLYFL